jgi:hypothetical protein
MSWLTFFIATLTVFAVGFFVYKFWVELVLLWVIAKALFYLTAISGMSTVLWLAFIENTTQGWQRTWLFFFFLYATILVVMVCIIFDAFHYGAKYLKEFLKK